MIGERFTDWTVESEAGRDSRGRRRVVAKCVCGTVRSVDASSIISGQSTGCGCRRNKSLSESTPGHRSAEYQAWIAMRARCLNPSKAEYPNYGGRGITICDRWESYALFLEDMGRKPSSFHTLDRIDNDGPYSKENCRWATRSRQQRNRRVNKILRFRGKSMCLADWADHLGMSQATLGNRLLAGWSIERALTTPVRRKA